jgi:hypothetical protein
MPPAPDQTAHQIDARIESNYAVLTSGVSLDSVSREELQRTQHAALKRVRADEEHTARAVVEAEQQEDEQQRQQKLMRVHGGGVAGGAAGKRAASAAEDRGGRLGGGKLAGAAQKLGARTSSELSNDINKVQDAMKQAVSAMLRNGSDQLDLQECGVTEETAGLLGPVLSHCFTAHRIAVRSLTLDNNALGDAGLNRMLESLMQVRATRAAKAHPAAAADERHRVHRVSALRITQLEFGSTHLPTNLGWPQKPSYSLNY